ncbi:cobalt-precorrin-5B (C(1))-methyltransferase [Vibrio sp. MA40-2]|uniref:cobalt-precorrin-5B (C(1))-methyltransferase n=1 Tax=Vibrio sp. MA40-2 TaxID=3391828 RepID=UPI0039A6BE1D
MGKLKRSANKDELRGGYTTGACAAASARAAVRMLVTQQSFSNIEIILPNKQAATFELHRLETNVDATSYGLDQPNSSVMQSVLAGIIKDAGDDPDCTHGIEIQCTAKWSQKPGIELKGGKGIARVTLPGLELQVGEPAINPVPRANIVAMVSLELAQLQVTNSSALLNHGVELTISAPRGEEVAKETISERLGLIGGISILGTRGTVKPYSTSAFAASVRQSIQIAAANKLDHVVLTTGSRSEKAAMDLFSQLGDMAFIQAGDFMGIGLRASKRYQINKVSMVVMMGKMGKLISGKMMTHVSGHAIDFNLLAELAKQEGMDPQVCEQILKANTGRHVLDIVRQYEARGFFTRLCKESLDQANKYINYALETEMILIDFDGTPLGRFAKQDELANTANANNLTAMNDMNKGRNDNG